jgi:hypothetical protein
VDLSKMRTPDWILGGCALVLIIDLLFFPWHKISYSFFGVSDSVTRSGVESPNAFWGILALLLAVAVIVIIVLRRLTTVQLPDLPISWADALFFGSIATLAVLLLKLVLETSSLGWGCWLAILLAAGMVYGGFATKQVETKGASTLPPTSF